MSTLLYYRKKRLPVAAAAPSWRGIGPINIGALNSTDNMFTQGLSHSPTIKPMSRPISGHLDSLFTSATQTAIDLTTGEGLALENSLKDAHTNGYKLTPRFRGGERFPHWTATATPAVNVWINQDGTAAARTNATPQAANDVPTPWDAGSTITTAAQALTAIAASAHKHWLDWMVQQIADWGNGTCPLATDGHNRWTHIHWMPTTGPSTFSTEMQMSSGTKTSPIDSSKSGDQEMLVLMETNSSSVTTAAHVKLAFEAAWKLAIDTCMAKYPSSVLVGISGSSIGWDTHGTVAGGSYNDTQWVVADYAKSQGYGARLVAHRTDWRYDYKSTFGGGQSTGYSPWNWFAHCHSQGQTLAIQTAGNSSAATGSVLEGAPGSTDADHIRDYVTTMEMLSQVTGDITDWITIETSSDMTDPPGNGSTWITGLQASVPATGGFPGGTVSISEYLYSAPGNLQSRL